jgi:hypothetical protein
MLEDCACCGAFAPRWDSPDYAEWVLELTPHGEYVGVVCPGCFAGEGLAFLGSEPPRARLVGIPGGAASSRLAAAA